MSRRGIYRLSYGLLSILMLGVAAGGIGTIYVDQLLREQNQEQINKVVKEISAEPIQNPWDYKLDQRLLRNIDFKKLKARNGDVDRWVNVPGTKIDYPVMQEQRLGQYKYNYRGLDGEWVISGSLLMPAQPIDEKTGKPAKDAHTLILGHRMVGYNGDWMFSHLPLRWGTVEAAKKNPYVYVYHPDRAERWRVWAAVDVRGNDKLYEIPFEKGSDDYQGLIDHMGSGIARYKIGKGPNKHEQTLVLSTCNDFSGREIGRFAIILVPDVTYYYDSGKYVTRESSLEATQWLEKQGAFGKSEEKEGVSVA